eukprot:15473532-Alexandrium_andersonii.AAC.1
MVRRRPSRSWGAPWPSGGRGTQPVSSRRRPLPLGSQTARAQAGCAQVRDRRSGGRGRSRGCPGARAGLLDEEVDGAAVGALRAAVQGLRARRRGAAKDVLGLVAGLLEPPAVARAPPSEADPGRVAAALPEDISVS